MPSFVPLMIPMVPQKDSTYIPPTTPFIPAIVSVLVEIFTTLVITICLCMLESSLFKDLAREIAEAFTQKMGGARDSKEQKTFRWQSGASLSQISPDPISYIFVLTTGIDDLCSP